ncbi:hypothetical protein SY85_23155 [Flavisolibacter tropicus]|uniref:Secretion system C-terminal sorting domain-containing protein n=2 Tax=Flavisolibacter tropicus TaxID=1492898 RepID=A0A172U144_9BACT|nr:hypothetical protein SY85_23155 [Flavisolibacter tropicus]
MPCLIQAQDALYVQNGATITVQANALISIKGNLQLGVGSQLQNSGTIEITQDREAISANWMDLTTKSYHYGNGLVRFTGAGRQSIATMNQLGKLEVNNKDFDLNSSVSADQWILVNGKINTQSNLAIVLDPSEKAISTSFSNSGFKLSWFNGTLRRHLSPSTVNHYSFPIGNQQKAFVAELDNLMTNPLNIQFLDVSFVPGPSANTHLQVIKNSNPFEAVLQEGVWELSPDATTRITGSYDLKLDRGSTNTSINSPIILNRLGNANQADWGIPEGTAPGITGLEVDYNIANLKQTASFGQFALATVEASKNVQSRTKAAVIATEKSLIVIGPNPANNQLRIHIDKPVTQLQGFISNANGTIVKTFTVQNNKTIDLTALNPGTYFITLPDGNGPRKAWQQKFLLVK